MQVQTTSEPQRRLGATLTALALSSAIVGNNLAFYTGYDKVKQKFELRKKLSGVFSFRSPMHTLDELNKVAGLSGLSILGMSILVRSELIKRDLRTHGTCLLAAHGVYSFYRHIFYWTAEKFQPALLGIAGLLSLTLAEFDHGLSKIYPSLYLSRSGLQVYLLLGITLGTLHFYRMEQVGGQLKVRPYGLLSLGIGMSSSVTGWFNLVQQFFVDGISISKKMFDF